MAIVHISVPMHSTFVCRLSLYIHIFGHCDIYNIQNPCFESQICTMRPIITMVFFRYCTFIFLFVGCFDQIDFLPWPWCHCRLIRYLSSLSFEFSLCSILACQQPIPRLRFPSLIWKQLFVGLLPLPLSAQFHFPCLIPFSNSQLTISFLFFCALIPSGQSCLFHFLAGTESRPQSIYKILQTILERFNGPYLKYT